jgi:L,D-transpeptidase YbiS
MVVPTTTTSIYISIASQTLLLKHNDHVEFECAISSAKNGVGEQNGSEQTPRGWHYIRARIGEGLPLNTVFVGRRPTGEIYSPSMRSQHPQRDWILTRILWLCGLEPGFNRLGPTDTMRRYIYIHGCPDEDDFAQPSSHGCIKLHNPDMLTLFERVAVGTRVLITE